MLYVVDHIEKLNVIAVYGVCVCVCLAPYNAKAIQIYYAWMAKSNVT